MIGLAPIGKWRTTHTGHQIAVIMIINQIIIKTHLNKLFYFPKDVHWFRVKY